MSLTMLLGGVRSGKSRLAVELARRSDAPVTLIASAEPGDEEMAERIRRHRAARPSSWRTIEEPLELVDALEGIPDQTIAVIDCLTLWVSNLIGRGIDDGEIERRGVEAAQLASGRPGPTIAVSNEVGLGIVPANDLARRFADTLGRVNAIWVGRASRSFLVVAGGLVAVGSPDAIFTDPILEAEP
jgi:adenosylcobinamide kinase / adenosylcobinamide-phosphate guanylyltransferase